MKPSIRITYRYDLPAPIGPFTNDVGWGCMVRSTQMMVANALCKFYDNQSHIISFFMDHPNAPLSIHKFAEYGEENLDVDIGAWFGPLTAALTIQALVQASIPDTINVHVAMDQRVVINELLLQHDAPTLCLIPSRFGVDKVDPVYIDTLREIIKSPFFVGICGGKNHSATYIFDSNEDANLLFLDPHFLQRYTDDVMSPSYRITPETKKILPIDQLHPNVLCGFLLTCKKDVETFIDNIQRLTNCPFVVTESAADPFDIVDETSDEDGFCVI